MKIHLRATCVFLASSLPPFKPAGMYSQELHCTQYHMSERDMQHTK